MNSNKEQNTESHFTYTIDPQDQIQIVSDSSISSNYLATSHTTELVNQQLTSVFEDSAGKYPSMSNSDPEETK
jgi:hypothetical protein